MIILDTDCFSLLYWETNQQAKALAERVLAIKDDEVCVTIITFEEQMRGWLSMLAKAKDEPRKILAYLRLTEMLRDYAKVRVITYDQEASFHYQRLVKAKLKVGTMDLRIAAIALANSALVVTRNTHDFGRITSLRHEDWTKD